MISYRIDMYKNPNGSQAFPARTCRDLHMSYPELKSGLCTKWSLFISFFFFNTHHLCFWLLLIERFGFSTCESYNKVREISFQASHHVPHNHEIGPKCVGNRPVIQSMRWLFLESLVFQLINLSFIYLLMQTILSTVASLHCQLGR